ncbi:tyrosine-type recombinase/integrase [Methylobacterium sp. ID0610]|uniref:tyrosine-type recombinase/integrase n=1 Tax=Methylobacterium carpenticola TaxID=3344827 RepID=UPI00367FF74D
MKFTNQSVAAIRVPAGKPYVLVFDEVVPGFGIRVSAGGSRQWVVQYRDLKGKSARMTLARVEHMPLGQARDAARDHLAKVRLGEDPRAAKAEEEKPAPVTVGELVPRYIAHIETRLRPSSVVAARHHLERQFAGLHAVDVTAVRRADVAAAVGTVSAEVGPQSALRARAVLSGFFSWAIGEGIAHANPVMGSNRPAPPSQRERVLTDDELAAIWRACEGDGDDFGRVVRLLILTAARRDEVAQLAWSELDLAGALWTLPAARSKNRRAHEVPLSRPALEILQGKPQLPGRDFVFGVRAGGFQGFSKSKARLDERSGVTDWVIHDLRRTAATGMAGLGVLPHVVEAVLNHVSGSRAGVAGIYNRASYAAEKRAALDLWARHVVGLRI